MSWKTALSISCLVMISVFVFLSGNIVEEAFGVEGVVISYLALSFFLGLFVFVLLRWVEQVIHSSSTDTSTEYVVPIADVDDELERLKETEE